MKLSAKLTQRLGKAKTQLLLKHPFYASLLLKSGLIASNRVPTAATNGKQIIFNPAFFENKTTEEIMFILAHEVLHKAFRHAFRLHERQPELWNISADMVINDMLVKDGFSMIKGAIKDSRFGANSLVDDVYQQLLKERNTDNNKDDKETANNDGNSQSDTNNSDSGNQPASDSTDNNTPAKVPAVFDHDHLRSPEATTSEEHAAAEQEIREQVLEASVIATQAGKLPAHIEKLVTELRKSQIDWRTALRKHMQPTGKDDRSYARTNRRYTDSDIIMPTQCSERMENITIVLDTSRSIYADKDALNAFFSEINAIKYELNPREMHLIYTDTKVAGHEIFYENEELTYKVLGGGGTDFTRVSEYMMHEVTPKPELVVFFTDMQVNCFGESDIPTIWVNTADDHNAPPYGVVIPLKTKD